MLRNRPKVKQQDKAGLIWQDSTLWVRSLPIASGVKEELYYNVKRHCKLRERGVTLLQIALNSIINFSTDPTTKTCLPRLEAFVYMVCFSRVLTCLESIVKDCFPHVFSNYVMCLAIRLRV